MNSSRTFGASAVSYRCNIHAYTRRMNMNKDLELAINNFRQLSAKYSRPERYYRGEHDLSFATEKFQNAFGSLFREFAMNLCPAIVDAVKDKLRLNGFRVAGLRGFEVGEREKRDPNFETTRNSLNFATRAIWHGNRMGQRAGELHKEALRCGDAYAVVWFDPRGEVTIYPQRAASMTVQYDEESPGRIRWAAKHWRDADKRIRINLYYADRIERYVSREPSEGAISDAVEFVAFVDSGRARRAQSLPFPVLTSSAKPPAHAGGSDIPNPFGIVPVFHFANNADIGTLGVSELVPAIPIQDGLNKSILDMLVAMEFSAFRQRWIAGLDVETDPATGKQLAPFQAGVERMWVASNSDTKFGDFNTSNLEQFLSVKDGFRIDMASVTGTPLHYFLQNTRGFASGESLRKNEMRFLAKIRDRQEAFGQTWADLMSFALLLGGHTTKPVKLVTDWEDPAPLDEKDLLANILLKKQIGITTEQALEEAGYGDGSEQRKEAVGGQWSVVSGQ